MSTVFDATVSREATAELTDPLEVEDRLLLSQHWHGWQRKVKRVADVLIAVLLLVVLAPLLLALMLLIRLDTPGAVIYSQERCGHNGRRFKFYKFRSMVLGAEEQQEALADQNDAVGPIFKMKDDPRVTRIGRIIRRTSLDELPQLWNVLRGEMSLVGPRPPVPSEVSRYEPWQRKRLAGVPGLTGLWQVSGRSELTFDDMVRLDVEYLEHWSLLLDLRILAQTVWTVLTLQGAY